MTTQQMTLTGTSDDNADAPIVATKVGDAERLNFLPTFFGARYMLRGEMMVYAWMNRLCEEYSGGFWEFMTLSNGGGFLSLRRDGPLHVRVNTNGYAGDMSAEAASIVATLFALCQLCEQTRHDSHIERYHLLRDFAAEHAEAASIYRAID
jgi:hypothetical protein